MRPELFTKAEGAIAQLVPAIVGGVISMLITMLAFFLKNAFSKSDRYAAVIVENDRALRKEIADLNQAIGILNAAKDRAKEEDERLRQALQQAHEEIRDLREKVIVLEHTAGLE